MSWLENIDIQFQHKDIISMDVDVIVSTITVNIEAYGKIGQKLFQLGWNTLNNDLLHLKDGLSKQKLDLGQAISLDCKAIYNIGEYKKLIFVALWDAQSEYDFNLFYKAYINSLREAFKYNMKSIALPIMAYDGNLKICGQVIHKVIHDLDGLKDSDEFSLEEIFFVSNNSNHINFLKKEIEPKLY